MILFSNFILSVDVRDRSKAFSLITVLLVARLNIVCKYKNYILSSKKKFHF